MRKADTGIPLSVRFIVGGCSWPSRALSCVAAGSASDGSAELFCVPMLETACSQYSKPDCEAARTDTFSTDGMSDFAWESDFGFPKCMQDMCCFSIRNVFLRCVKEPELMFAWKSSIWSEAWQMVVTSLRFFRFWMRLTCKQDEQCTGILPSVFSHHTSSNWPVVFQYLCIASECF